MHIVVIYRWILFIHLYIKDRYFTLANFDCIEQFINNYDWENTFYNADVNKEVLSLKETILTT